MRQFSTRTLLIFASLLLQSNFAHASYDCQDLTGSWSHEQYDKNQKIDRRLIETISEDGTYWIKFIFIDDDEFVELEENGTWECSQDILTVTYNKRQGRARDVVIAYKILELEDTTYTLETIGNGVVYKYFKVIN